ncbi:hypothetical protein DYI24_07445 [Rhodopseudomonas sp. BR0C11]|uniref:hypothetical protein n=1 Tax=Rhodopseudomonas sp. BR0C11 TaxID=2269370 RepID=UPI0013DFC72B|nr:hypothetical protein [Rhodopseudomonas sp. BR0C11]NEV76876.1 hypothetical protein [Rhodopseudomonas sp. BR0C11]
MVEKSYLKFASEALTNCSVSADGATVLLGFKDSKGRDASLELPLAQAGSLAMTLPSLIEHAVRRHFRDSSLRYSYPLESWQIERSSDPETGMVTLRTKDGFSVCFSMPVALQSDLGHALTSPPQIDAPTLAN